jgi:methionine-gamma-lyase
MDKSKLRFGTKSVYYEQEPSTHSINYPIFTSANYQYDEAIYQSIVDGNARKDINIYSRCGNPTEYKFEDQVALLEGAKECLATASGMGAVSHAIFGLVKAGDHIISDWTTYSSTHEWFDHRITNYGIEVSFVDTTDIKQVEAAIRPNTKVIYFETIANPTMKVPAMEPIVKLAHSKNIAVVCDNTFASPAVCRPHEFGVDVVVESATKFIGGHNDAVGGVITFNPGVLPENWLENVRWNTLNKWGAALSPFNSWLLLRGIQTLDLRLERQCANAMKLAKYLEAHPKVSRVWYPGLPSHPQYEVAKKQMPSFGAMLTFELGTEKKAVKVLTSLKLATFAASLGGVRTCTQVPSTMAFLDIEPEQKAKMNVHDGMARVSVGIETIEDLLEDFEQALSQL